MNQSYVHPSHVEMRETAAPHPTRDQILAEQDAADRRRRRAELARHITRRRSRE